MTHYAALERAELADTLAHIGAAAPTLCAPWTTSELATHLVLRDRLSPAELAGRVPTSRTRAIGEAAIAKYTAAHPFDEVVATFRSGPPRWSPFSVGPLDEAINLLEFAVHHEDVRRAATDTSLQPRQLSFDRQRRMWTQLRVAARMTLRQAPVGVVLTWPSHGSVAAAPPKGGRTITVIGAPLELALVAFGRQWVADVAYDGEPAAVSALTEARIAV